MTGRRRRWSGFAFALLLLGACSSPSADSSDEPSDPDRSRPTAETSPSDAVPSQPVVLAVSLQREPPDLSLAEARRVIRGEVDDWRELGGTPGPLRVTRDPRELRRLSPFALAVVAADELLPTVRVLEVAGVHPLREPGRYRPRMPGDASGADERGAEPPTVTTLTLVGDIMLDRGVRAVPAATRDPGFQLRVLAPHLRRADIAVGNLESTLSEAGPPTQGDDSFAAPPEAANALVDAGFDALSLANNHAGDFGPVALVGTVRRLRAAGLATFGAGRTEARAWQPTIMRHTGTTFGFLGFNAIGETPDVAAGGPGAVSISMPPRTGPLDRAALTRFQGAVRRLDSRVDVVVVLPHWGTQYTHRPEPIQHRVARAIVRAGADVVVGGHPHWVQGAELVGEALVVHSLGNFVFDMDFMEQTQEGLVLDLVFWDGRLMGADYLPYRMDEDFTPRPLSWSAAARILQGFSAFTRF